MARPMSSPGVSRRSLALFPLLAVVSAWAAGCTPPREEKTVVPVQVVDGHVLVRASVNGSSTPRVFMIDSGAPHTTLSPDAVADARTRVVRGRPVTGYGVGPA